MFDESKKGTISNLFVSMRKHKDNVVDLFELLEDKKIFIAHFDKRHYQIFCEAYVIMLLEQYISDINVREPMLVSYRLLEDYERLKYVRDRHMRYSERAAATNELISEGWADPNDSLQDIEDKAIEKLVDQLINDAVSDKDGLKSLGLANTVIKQLETQFPKGLPRKLPLPKPRYKKPDATDKQAIQSGSPLDSKLDGASLQNDPPKAHAHSEASVNSTTVVQNHVQVTVVAPEGTRATDTEQRPMDITEKPHPPSNISGFPLPLLDSDNRLEPTPSVAPETKGRQRKPLRLVIVGFIAVACIAVACIVPVAVAFLGESNDTPLPPVNEIFVTDAEIFLKPNAVFVLSTAILPPEAQNTPLSFVSSDPKVVTVSRDGRLQVPESHEAGGTQVADITIQAENGVTKIKTVTVDFSADSHDALTVDIDDFVPEFTVEQKIRLAGTSGWNYNVEAEVGDFVEIQIQFKNLSDTTAKDVMVRDALPVNMVYIPGSTKLYNSYYPDGENVNQDTIAATTGINIGNYTKDANAYIRFMARIVDATLADGSNTLVSWSQACVNGVTLQDYATAVLQKTT